MSDQKNIEKKLSESRVRIITHQNVRYEGILYQINSKEKTVALKNVKSFGTEDRPTDKVIGPKERIYEFIVFRSDEIQNLAVLKENEQTTETVQTQKNDDQQQEEVNEKEEEIIDQKEEKMIEQNEQKTEQDQQQEKVDTKQEVQNEQKSNKKHKKERFAFNEMVDNIDEFHKQKSAPQQHIQNYVQDDFFDNLTSSVNDKGGDSHYYRYKTTKETFGYVPNKSHKRGRAGHKTHNSYNRRGRGGNKRPFVKKKDNKDTGYEYVKKS